MFNLGPEFWKGLLYALLAFGGGILGYLMRTLEEEDEPIHWGKALVQGLSSGFTGLLMYFLCVSLGLDGWMTGAVVGFFGWAGAGATILVLEKFVYKRLGINKNRSNRK